MCFEIKTPKQETCKHEIDKNTISVKECIEYAIENFSTEEATKRILSYIDDSIKLQKTESYNKGFLDGRKQGHRDSYGDNY